MIKYSVNDLSRINWIKKRTENCAIIILYKKKKKIFIVVRICALKWIQIQNLLRAKSTLKRIMDVYQPGLDNDVSEICLGNGHTYPHSHSHSYHHHHSLCFTSFAYASFLFARLFFSFLHHHVHSSHEK